MRAIVVAATCLAAAACGLGPLAGDGGGADNLPTSGAGPYGKLPLDLETPADEPTVLADRRADLTDPEMARRDDGGFRVWFQSRVPGGAAEIDYAELPSLTDLPDVAPHLVLAAELPWEGGEVRAPAALVDGDQVTLYYEAGDPPAIGRAISSDGGASFTRDAEPVIAAARHPSAVLAGDTIYVFFESGADPGIFVAESADGISFTVHPDPVLVASGDPEAFDGAAVGNPGAVATRTAAGRIHFGLFYDGRNGLQDESGEPEVAIGYAGGFDVDALVRFADGDPVLHPLPPAESGASVVLEPARGLMLFSQARGARLQIAGAVHP